MQHLNSYIIVQCLYFGLPRVNLVKKQMHFIMELVLQIVNYTENCCYSSCYWTDHDCHKTLLWVCLLGTPIWHVFTFEANLKLHNDSPKDLGSGEMLTNIRVLESPPRHG